MKQYLKRDAQHGFASIFLVIAAVLVIGGGATTTYFVQKSAVDKKRAADLATQQIQESHKPAENEPQKPAEQTTPTPTCVRDTTMYVSVSDGHALRADKNLDSAKSITVPYRAALKVGCKDGEWYSAEYNGQVGYAFAGYLTSTLPAAPVVGNMSQDKCLKVSTLYAVKDPTPVYKWADDGKVVNAGITVPKGTAISGGECTMWAGTVVPGYWERDARLYSFSDMSTNKP